MAHLASHLQRNYASMYTNMYLTQEHEYMCVRAKDIMKCGQD